MKDFWMINLFLLLLITFRLWVVALSENAERLWKMSEEYMHLAMAEFMPPDMPKIFEPDTPVDRQEAP